MVGGRKVEVDSSLRLAESRVERLGKMDSQGFSVSRVGLEVLHDFRDILVKRNDGKRGGLLGLVYATIGALDACLEGKSRVTLFCGSGLDARGVYRSEGLLSPSSNLFVRAIMEADGEVSPLSSEG